MFSLFFYYFATKPDSVTNFKLLFRAVVKDVVHLCRDQNFIHNAKFLYICKYYARSIPTNLVSPGGEGNFSGYSPAFTNSQVFDVFLDVRQGV